ncbi:hypothetical protein C8A03DRAFT_13118 [Achaetomium macrosporum]|uniref:Zn(2)-C6 fungal-type domain-containing protein n=1 Tax=Achaetomium macrosporum TaxID=79813 RepID=A0AAN7HG36_9PEZI|nr:hypothetical protein C8A03DRAFT_13118 [Achaetomium macrosporum]
MNGVSRHIACVSCRDRKVRCNGEQPACEKCRQAGEKCVYLPTCRPSKADLAQKVDTLQQRLGKSRVLPTNMHQANVNAAGDIAERAEAYIRKMENEANCSRATSYFSPTAMSPVSLPSATPVTPLPLQIATPPTPATFAAGLFHPQPGIQFPEMPGGDFLYTPILDPQALPGGMDGAQLESQVEDPERPLDHHARKSSSISIPSLREIRELNSALSSTRPRSASALGTHGSDRTGRECEGCSAIMNELAAYCMAVSSAHSDIAGISLALAEYLAWMRKAANLKTTDVTSMLETLECRAREVHDMVETRPWAALKHMVAALKPLGRASSRLTELEHDFCRQSTEAGQFFQTEYDIRVALPNQRKPPTAELGLPVPIPTPSDAPDARLDTQT